MFQTQESSVLLSKHQAMGMEEKKNVSNWIIQLVVLLYSVTRVTAEPVFLAGIPHTHNRAHMPRVLIKVSRRAVEQQTDKLSSSTPTVGSQGQLGPTLRSCIFNQQTHVEYWILALRERMQQDHIFVEK